MENEIELSELEEVIDEILRTELDSSIGETIIEQIIYGNFSEDSKEEKQFLETLDQMSIDILDRKITEKITKRNGSHFPYV